MRDRFTSKYLWFVAGVICSVTVSLQVRPSLAQPNAKPPAKTAKKAKPPQAQMPQTNSLLATEGVQLIEEIFLKLRNVPQLAVANSQKFLAYQQAPQAQQTWGAADSNLMIKPAQGNVPRAMPSASSYSYSGEKGIDKGSLPMVADAANKSSPHGARWSFDPNRWRTAPVQNQNEAQQQQGSLANLRSANVWEKGRPQAQAAPQAVDELEQDTERAKDAKTVSTYGGRPDQSGNVLSSAPLIKEFRDQQLATGSSNGLQQSAGAPKARNSGTNLDDAFRKASSPQFNRLAKSLSGANLPDVSFTVQASAARQRPSQLKTSSGFVTGVGGGLVPPPPAELIALRGAPMSAVNSDFAPQGVALAGAPQMIDARINITAKKKVAMSRAAGVRGALTSKSEREEIALLPLTKFSGIPLVSLGDSDSDLSKRLGSVGVVEITMVKPWIVWSVKQRGSQDISLQVFSQKGVVEAVRVKDKSVWTNQQGISLGDDVSVVKEKFGEPAFILSHPIPSGNKVYVYPISQVAFRLERAGETPRIKDIIIFNVK